MLKNKKLIALIICFMIVFSFVFSVSFISSESFHHCSHTSCHVCVKIDDCVKAINLFTLGVLCFSLLSYAKYKAHELKAYSNILFNLNTPITLKIKLTI